MDDLGKHPKGMDSTPVGERAKHAAQKLIFMYTTGGDGFDACGGAGEARGTG